eukprot:SAG22_NODE_12945_length_424_cov_0.633846_1_plen_106_part_10
MRQRVELTNRCIGIVEDNFALEPILDMRFRAASTRSASLEEYGKESEAAAATSSSGSGGDGTGVAAAAGTGSGGGGGGGAGASVPTRVHAEDLRWPCGALDDEANV